MQQFLLVSQMLSPIVLVIGLFRLLVALKLLDSLNAVVFVYATFNIAFSVWMLQSYFSTIPKDLEEAAWMEGATPWQALRKVFLPLALPAMTVTADLLLHQRVERVRHRADHAAQPGELHPAHPGVLAGGRALHGRVAPRDGSGVCRDDPRGHRLCSGCNAISCAASPSAQ